MSLSVTEITESKDLNYNPMNIFLVAKAVCFRSQYKYAARPKKSEQQNTGFVNYFELEQLVLLL